MKTGQPTDGLMTWHPRAGPLSIVEGHRERKYGSLCSADRAASLGSHRRRARATDPELDQLHADPVRLGDGAHAAGASVDRQIGWWPGDRFWVVPGALRPE